MDPNATIEASNSAASNAPSWLHLPHHWPQQGDLLQWAQGMSPGTATISHPVALCRRSLTSSKRGIRSFTPSSGRSRMNSSHASPGRSAAWRSYSLR